MEAQATIGNKTIGLSRDDQDWTLRIWIGRDAPKVIYITDNSDGAWAAYTATRNALEASERT